MANEPNSDEPSQETLRLELQQAIETFRQVRTLYVQMLGFLIAVDSLLVGYGVAQGKAALLVVASGIPLALFIVRKMIARHAVPLVFVAIRIEAQLHLGQQGLIATYARFILPAVFGRLASPTSADYVPEVEREFEREAMRTQWGRAEKLLAGIFALQLVLFLLSLTVFKLKIA